MGIWGEIYTEERHPSWVWTDQFIHKELGGGHSKDEESHKGVRPESAKYTKGMLWKISEPRAMVLSLMLIPIPSPHPRQLNQKL